jgi:hypothetical protein
MMKINSRPGQESQQHGWEIQQEGAGGRSDPSLVCTYE